MAEASAVRPGQRRVGSEAMNDGPFAEQYGFRDGLVEALERDLVGPASDDETIVDPPITRYITGSCSPAGIRLDRSRARRRPRRRLRRVGHSRPRRLSGERPIPIVDGPHVRRRHSCCRVGPGHGPVGAVHRAGR